MSTHQSATRSRFLLPLLPVVLLANCAPFYPFGASHNGRYFGGQGNAVTPSVFVPRGVQREAPIFDNQPASPKRQAVISYR